MHLPESYFMRTFTSLALLLAAACSGGGSSGSSPATPSAAGTVEVVIDTATGSDALVQFQVVAATLATDTGGMTGNLLAAPKMLTLADPMAATDGVTLTGVPSGTYSSLRLGIAPQSGMALYPNGTTVPVSTAFELAIPLADALVHDSSRASWVVVGHFGSAPAQSSTAAFSWTPMLRGYGAETQVELSDLAVALVESTGLTATDPVRGGAPLHLSFEAGCTFFDDSGNSVPNSGVFLANVARDDSVSCRGLLRRDGSYALDQIQQAPPVTVGNQRSRLIGRITSIDAGTRSFVMTVLAEARRGEHHFLPLPAEARVDASSAEIELSRGQHVAFATLAVGNLVKVEWQSRQPNNNGPENVVAREVEVAPSGGVGMRPEWQGRVDAVDLQQRTITVVPRGNDPIVIEGQSVNSVTVHVGTNVSIERRANHGGGRSSIQLSEIVAGRDRIWWRGTVVAANEIEASSVRVRDDG
ncbi:MAG: hypothetical protein KDE27_20275 [Planctomycetes bacterium]|nr:hypothetical protein [Planctomycetota bacterium]